ncbi:MAG: adenylyl-sulfate kinase, partial [Lachnospiraceae bacterium]|nr:adenylyl-sulfate kinase [Lachnospiraceae bacterium]
YRYFNTEKRSFIVADTPGHEEYTRNMAVGASFAELAIILVDASKGLLTQTRRHARICALMGIRHFVFAVNKMDLVSYDKEVFKGIEVDIRRLMAEFDWHTVCVIPVSATEGDNVTNYSGNMPWYKGKNLLAYLEDVDVSKEKQGDTFIMPVQRVCRPNAGFRGFQGQVVQGTIAVGDEIKVLPSGETACVSELYILNKKVEGGAIVAGQAVTVVLDREVDISRGCVLTTSDELSSARLFRANILWMDDNELIEGRNYLVKIGTKLVLATVLKLHHQIDVNTGEKKLIKKGHKNEIISCDINVSEKIVIDSFDKCQAMGRFILIDRVTNMTSACGVVEYILRRSDNLTYQNMDITRDIRAEKLAQKPVTLWFTGLSGSGKSTVANAVEKELISMGKHTMILDGDNVRMGLNKNLGFTEADRVENIRRIAEVAKLMNDAGLIVLVAAISPFAEDRANARDIIGDAYKEIYVSTPLEVCESRDVKGLYAKARRGDIPNFTGVSSPYEPPMDAELVIDTSKMGIEVAVEMVVKLC